MENIFGTTERLELKDKNGVVRYRYNRDVQYTYDSNGNELTFEDSDGYWCKSTYDSSGNRLTSEDSHGDWSKYTYDSSGNKLTFEDSYGTKRGFDTPEYTMEELTKELGHNFKIKK
jgi:YD repeat-containing protein